MRMCNKYVVYTVPSPLNVQASPVCVSNNTSCTINVSWVVPTSSVMIAGFDVSWTGGPSGGIDYTSFDAAAGSSIQYQIPVTFGRSATVNIAVTTIAQNGQNSSTVSLLTTTPPPPLQYSTNYDWARLVLHDGGWARTPTNVAAVTQWMGSETNNISEWWTGGNPITSHINPLNDGLKSFGNCTYTGYSSGGLGTYNNLPCAADSVALALIAGAAGGVDRYGAIVAAFNNSSSSETLTQSGIQTIASAIWNSRWARSHYGNPHGSQWWGSNSGQVSTNPVPPVSAPSSLW